MNEDKLKKLESKLNIIEHIIRVIFSLIKTKLDNPIRIQIEKALLNLTELKS